MVEVASITANTNDPVRAPAIPGYGITDPVEGTHVVTVAFFTTCAHVTVSLDARTAVTRVKQRLARTLTGLGVAIRGITALRITITRCNGQTYDVLCKENTHKGVKPPYVDNFVVRVCRNVCPCTFRISYPRCSRGTPSNVQSFDRKIPRCTNKVRKYLRETLGRRNIRRRNSRNDPPCNLEGIECKRIHSRNRRVGNSD